MNKFEKRKLLQEYQIKQMEEFEENLPMEKKLFYELFDYLNDKSETVECNHDFSLTKPWVKDVSMESLLVFNNLWMNIKTQNLK